MDRSQHCDGFPRNGPRLSRMQDLAAMKNKNERQSRAGQGGESVDVPSSNTCPSGLIRKLFFSVRVSS